MTQQSPHRHVMSVEASAEYAALEERLQTLIDTALTILEADPYAKPSFPDGPTSRRAYIAPGLAVRYGLHHDTLVIAEIIHENSSYLVPGERS